MSEKHPNVCLGNIGKGHGADPIKEEHYGSFVDSVIIDFIHSEGGE